MPSVVIPEEMQSQITTAMGLFKSDASTAFEDLLTTTYTRIAEEIRDERDTIIEAIEEGDRYRGREVVQILDGAFKDIIGVFERNLPAATESPGITDLYFNLINN